MYDKVIEADTLKRYGSPHMAFLIDNDLLEGRNEGRYILSKRGKDILSLIGCGYRSQDIAS